MNQPQSSTETMRAWAIDAYGAPLRLIELPVPQPGPDDLLIHMDGAEVGQWDERVRLGEWPAARKFPLVPGLAGSGIVVAAGDNVRSFAIGDPVFACSYPFYDNGAWAEFMLVPASYAAAPPAGMPLAAAGAVPVAGLTAHRALIDILRVQAADVVLIAGAAGGVGHLAVQIAEDAGARVVATTSRHNRDFVAALGAELVIDYTSQDVPRAIRRHFPDGVDKALNCVTGDAANEAALVLRDGGHMVDLPGAVTVARPGVRIDKGQVVQGDGARLRLVAAMIDDALLEVEIQDIMPFEFALLALELVLARHVRGKIGLRIE
jgi:NADPH:quinone reductase-like Zn-dependent oxidoreductase